MCVAVTITPQEAHELWVLSGREAWLFTQHEQAAQQAGLVLSYVRQGDLLIIEAEAHVASAV